MQVTEYREPLTGLTKERREFFVGRLDSEMHARMDERRAKLEAEGHTFVKRTKIGRNAPCPCKSGRKFKKCCMSGAERVGARR